MAAEVKVVICGCGPGAAEYVTPAVWSAIGRAEVLVGARRLQELCSAFAGERIIVGADTAAALDEIAARRDRRVVVLVTGDAGLFSFAQSVVKRFGRDACEVLPGVSAVQVAFARLGLDWSDARILSAHHLPPDMRPEKLLPFDKLAILLGRADALAWVADLLAASRNAYDVFICENLTLPDERVRRVPAEELRDIAAGSLAIAVLIRKGALE